MCCLLIFRSFDAAPKNITVAPRLFGKFNQRISIAFDLGSLDLRSWVIGDFAWLSQMSNTDSENALDRPLPIIVGDIRLVAETQEL